MTITDSLRKLAAQLSELQLQNFWWIPDIVDALELIASRAEQKQRFTFYVVPHAYAGVDVESDVVPDELTPPEKKLWGAHPTGRRHTRALLMRLVALRRQVFSLGGTAMGRDYDHRLGFNDGFKAGLQAASKWFSEQKKHYPEDIFVPPPTCLPGETHDFDYGAPEQRCTHCHKRPGMVDQYAAAMARMICETWPENLKKEMLESFELHKEEIYDEYERNK